MPKISEMTDTVLLSKMHSAAVSHRNRITQEVAERAEDGKLPTKAQLDKIADLNLDVIAVKFRLEELGEQAN